MQPVLLVVQFILAVALIGVILLQRSAQDGGGLTGGGNTMGGLFTARGSANLLTHTTAGLATLFILNSLLLGFLASHSHRPTNIVDQIAPISSTATPPTGDKALGDKPASAADEAPKAPVVPEVPLAH